MASTRRPARTASAHAFTLIELLVVIAIIAILTAILLPVFASVREGARQSTSISNMKDIQQKMEQFKLDNHRYPDVLFGYAYRTSTMKSALGDVQNDHQNDLKNNVTDPAILASHNPALFFPGLYPAYIKDPEVFTDPNNTVNSGDAGKLTGQLAINLVAPCNAVNDATLSGTASACAGSPPPTAGNTVGTTRNFYLADAYDTSPIVMGTNTFSGTSIVRYQLAREQTAANVATADASYSYQLRWQNPPAGAVITATTYHVKNADKVLVMFESGAIKKVTGHDFATLDGSNAAPTFWQVADPNYPANLKP